MNRRARKPYFSLLLVFVVLNGFFISSKGLLTRNGFDQDALVWGNVVVFLITLGSFLLAQRGLKDKNPNAFVRSVYGSVMLKLFLCIIAAFAYIAVAQKHINKPALFTLMGLYLVYTFIEVSALTRQLRGQGSNPPPGA
ncbi:hypothetical protein EPD60_05180 [Flaviaesturariibacter flavus]|uniref:ATP synthase subunit I n=1 Tax=Flaviaesturariibacter flavus TaxID=2502780 RepID=A0A4R1BK52_9BACT|nr:hypothetical protein [Flaviaesturariibacter flavus]TCJ17588.1 hypothetical protein EPD60_05180 [Flaviaesturariibacter flavus]